VNSASRSDVLKLEHNQNKPAVGPLSRAQQRSCYGEPCKAQTALLGVPSRTDALPVDGDSFHLRAHAGDVSTIGLALTPAFLHPAGRSYNGADIRVSCRPPNPARSAENVW